MTFIFSSTVGITWEDAPEDQYATIYKDSKIRCLVKARPAAEIDWLKENLVLSPGKFQNQEFSTCRVVIFFFYFFLHVVGKKT